MSALGDVVLNISPIVLIDTSMEKLLIVATSYSMETQKCILK